MLLLSVPGGAWYCAWMPKKRFEGSKLVADWYEVLTLQDNLYCIDEQDHVAFFVLKNGNEALLIDSGLGLMESKAKVLFEHLGVSKISVCSTHSHCDHVGLNYLADRVYILKEEWEKFLSQKEEQQIGGYYKMLKGEMEWPRRAELPPEQQSWRPTDFIRLGETLEFGEFKLEPKLLPGHTLGHIVLFERAKHLVFCGDFVITGTNYLHLKDSSVTDYVVSVKVLIDEMNSGPTSTVLTCHNDIPLPQGYLEKVLAALRDIQSGKSIPMRHWDADELFVDSELYDNGEVRLTIKSSELEALRKSVKI